MTNRTWSPATDVKDRPRFKGWRSKEFVPLEIIEAYAEDTLRLFAEACGGRVAFPLQAERLVKELFQLEVYYDDGTIMDRIDSQLLGSLYAEGMICPATGSDRVIMVNDASRYADVTASFTILHEAGHWLIHHPVDAAATEISAYCRSEEALPTWSKVPPREWQANRLAGEVLMPTEMVARVLDGCHPPEIVNLAIYGPRFREFFDVSQAAMEKRLSDLGYTCVGGRRAFADVRETRGR